MRSEQCTKKMAHFVDQSSKKENKDSAQKPEHKARLPGGNTPPLNHCSCELLLERDRNLSLNETVRCRLSKRLMMVLPLAALAGYWYVPEDLYFSLYFLSPVCFVSSFVLLCNIPQLGSWIHTKPLHVNDLRVLHSTKQNFLWWYTYITNALLAVVITGIIDWTFTVQKKHHAASAVEILGTLGGVLSLYLKIESVVAISLLHLTFQCKEHKKKSEQQQGLDKTAVNHKETAAASS